MSAASRIALPLGAALFAACADNSPAAFTGELPRGAAIDGSEDPPGETPDDPRESPGAAAQGHSAAAATAAQPTPGTAEEENAELEITYQDLSLVDYDVDAMLDLMLFPEEYDGDDAKYLAFPSELLDLCEREVSIVGYMIPGDMKQGRVGDFMLVRDLLGCCFGGSPMPDEWIDVLMIPGETAEYRPYLPMRVHGTLSLGGTQDEAGFAMGIYKMSASAVQLED